ncbi:MAG: OmpH family outer membrane protein [Crocinitomicaceae bacterium]|nr:OmpH family outer membrane protein [Crocinitomicaceae bacterium]
MKKILIAIIAVFTVGGFSAIAQNNVTFAHVSSAAVLDSIQSYKDLVKEEQQINREAQKQYNVLQKKYMNLQPDGPAMDTLSDFELSIISGDIQKVQMDMQNLEVYTQNQLQVLQERLVKLMDMYREAVEIVAKKHGITYVFDADTQVLYAGPKGKDLTDEVRVELLRMDSENPVHRLK